MNAGSIALTALRTEKTHQTIDTTGLEIDRATSLELVHQAFAGGEGAEQSPRHADIHLDARGIGNEVTVIDNKFSRNLFLHNAAVATIENPSSPGKFELKKSFPCKPTGKPCPTNPHLCAGGMGDVGSGLETNGTLAKIDAVDIPNHGLGENHGLGLLAGVAKGIDEEGFSPKESPEQGWDESPGKFSFHRNAAVHADHSASFSRDLLPWL